MAVVSSREASHRDRPARSAGADRAAPRCAARTGRRQIERSARDRRAPCPGSGMRTTGYRAAKRYVVREFSPRLPEPRRTLRAWFSVTCREPFKRPGRASHRDDADSSTLPTMHLIQAYRLFPMTYPADASDLPPSDQRSSRSRRGRTPVTFARCWPKFRRTACLASTSWRSAISGAVCEVVSALAEPDDSGGVSGAAPNSPT